MVLKIKRVSAICLILGVATCAATPGGGRLYKPRGDGPYPAIIVLHTSGGLTSHEKDFARRLSKRGYVTLTVDYFARHGSNIEDGYDYLKTHPNVDPKRIGAVGFSRGARMALALASHVPIMSSDDRLSGIVCYYLGNTIVNWPKSLEHPPVLFLHGDRDVELSPSIILNYCKTQKQRGAICKAHIYKGVYHAFDRDSIYGHEDSRASADAWKRTLAFLDKDVKGKQ